MSLHRNWQIFTKTLNIEILAKRKKHLAVSKTLERINYEVINVIISKFVIYFLACTRAGINFSGIAIDSSRIAQGQRFNGGMENEKRSEKKIIDWNIFLFLRIICSNSRLRNEIILYIFSVFFKILICGVIIC